MLKSVEGVYRDGKIELTELPGDVQDETRVIVTFLGTHPIYDIHSSYRQALIAVRAHSLCDPETPTARVFAWRCVP